MNNAVRRLVCVAVSFVLALLSIGPTLAEVKLNPDKPLTLNIWHYYNGAQQRTFDQLALEFNETVGVEQGIIVESHSQGSVNDLAKKLVAAAERAVGADEMPDVFAAYADTAYKINQMGLVADLTQYMTAEEIDAYMDAYIEEGYLDKDGVLKVFPIAKSTELLMLNATEWAQFSQATGASEEKLATWEGIVELSEQFYNWTDGLTPDVANDGKAFFGRDAFANYMLIGSLQMGVEMFKVDGGQATLQIDDAVMRKLWDCYYVPYVNGWFGAYGKFRSDDIKTGQLSALVGSTSGALYFPTEVTRDDGTTYPIEGKVYVLPNFEGCEPYAVQQGAGLVVSKGSAEQEYAATVFLKWFTQADNNINFSMHSGYLPVLKAANSRIVLDKAMENKDLNGLLKNIIDVGVDVTRTYTLYTNDAFEHGYEARSVVEKSMPEAAKAAVVERDALIAQGMDRAQAVARLTTDEAFERWLSDFTASLNDVLAF